ncbi:MAG: hypothetical protein JSR86_10605 [Proteobacteria bacterium]|nr:hypothetical protein [Pseudomonadota bacterium]
MTIKATVLAGVAALSAVTAAAPSFAQDYRGGYDRGDYQTCREQKHNNGAAGAVIGTIFGAVIGSSVANHGSKTAGGLLGAGIGAAAGNAIGRSTSCNRPDSYGYNSGYRYDQRYGYGQQRYGYERQGYYDNRYAQPRDYDASYRYNGYDRYSGW